MYRFVALGDLFDVMNNLSGVERNLSRNSTASYARPATKGSSTATTERQKIVTCYNCKREGHYAPACTEPKRRSCYMCRRDGHLRRDGSRNNGRSGVQEVDSTTTRVGLIQSRAEEVSLRPAYCYPIQFVLGEEEEMFELSAICHTGSSISLIEAKYVPGELHIFGKLGHNETLKI